MAADPKAKFEEFLKNVKCRDGEPLLRHLGLVVEKMLVEHQATPITVFEEVSSKVAADRLQRREKQAVNNEDHRYVHDKPEDTREFVKRAAEHLVALYSPRTSSSERQKPTIKASQQTLLRSASCPTWWQTTCSSARQGSAWARRSRTWSTQR